jgi:curli biogenesis system outer membrane secretion channel CsgG
MKNLTRLSRIITYLMCVFLTNCATVTKPITVNTASINDISPSSESLSVSAKSGPKRKVAIARFSNETNYGQSVFIKDNPEKIGKQALDMLSSKLVATDKFILLERSDINLINNELQLGSLDPITNMADYLIVGSVTEFGRSDQGNVGAFSRSKKQTAFAKVTIRLIDVRNSVIIYSEEGSGEASAEAGTVLGMGSQAGYDSSLNDKALDAAITHLASNVIENLLGKPWTSFVLAEMENNQIIIAGGKSQNIKAGDRFDIEIEGSKVLNPQTNMYINLPGSKTAEVEVVMTLGNTPLDETSLCKIVNGTASARDGKFSHLRVVERSAK